MTIRTKIVRIGNSQGVRLSKTLLEQSGLTGEVEIEVRDGKIVIHGVCPVREDWETAYEKMFSSGDDEFLDADSASGDWDETQWEWN